MGEILKVGMADLKMCKVPDSLTTLGLGSCVGISLYDPITKISGMVHIMLPDSTKIKNNANLAKFADTGIEELVRLMTVNGANASRLIAKIAGGAQMFSFASNDEMMRVGDRNIEATIQKLNDLKIPIIAQDCGLNYGRTIVFEAATGDLLIKSVGKPDKKI